MSIKIINKALLIALPFLCLNPVIASDGGYYHMTADEKADVKEDINKSFLNKRVMREKRTHTARGRTVRHDFYKSKPRYWDGRESAISGLSAIVQNLYTSGVISETQKNEFFEFNEALLQEAQELIDECKWCKSHTSSRSRPLDYRERCGHLEASSCSTDLDFSIIAQAGLLNSKVYSEIEPSRRTDYIEFIRDKILNMIQTTAPGRDGEVCAYRKCQEGLECTHDPEQNYTSERCRAHSDCESQVCDFSNTIESSRSFGRTRTFGTCRPVTKCYTPQTEGSDCHENPVCQEGLSCREETSEEGGPESADSSSNRLACMNCSEIGESSTTSSPCCPGLISDPDSSSNVCVKAIPEDISYDTLVGDTNEDEDSSDLFLELDQSPTDMENCHFDWYQIYLQRLREHPSHFKREMGLLAFDFIAGGNEDEIVDDLWSVNSTLQLVAKSRREMRSWLFKVLDAAPEFEERVMEEIGTEMESELAITSETKNLLKDQFIELFQIKRDYQSSCHEINGSQNTAFSAMNTASSDETNSCPAHYRPVCAEVGSNSCEDEECSEDTSNTKTFSNSCLMEASNATLVHDGVCQGNETPPSEDIGADGVRAAELARFVTRLEKKLSQIEYNINISPSFQEIQVIKEEMRSKNWKEASYVRTTKKWKERKSWFSIVTTLLTNNFKALVTLDLEAAKDVVRDIRDIAKGEYSIYKDQLGPQLSEGIYSTMWGDLPPKVKRKEKKCKTKTSGIVCKYKLHIDWPESDCLQAGGSSGTVKIKGTSGSCLKRFSFIGFRDQPDVLVDPFVPYGMDADFFFRRGGKGQKDFYKLVNNAADNSIKYLKKRKKPGMNSKAIRKAFPDIGDGRHSITDNMKEEIKNNAIQYLDDQYPNLHVKQEFKQSWAEYVLKLHFIYPKLSKSPKDIGYPQRGLPTYLTALSSMLNKSVEENESFNENLNERIRRYDDHLNQLSQRLGRGIYQQTKSDQQAASADRRQSRSATARNTAKDSATSESGTANPATMDPHSSENTKGGLIAGESQNNLADNSLKSDQSSDNSAIARAYQKNRNKNKEIKTKMKTRDKAIKDAIESKGENFDQLSRKLAKVVSNYSSPTQSSDSTKISKTTPDFGTTEKQGREEQTNKRDNGERYEKYQRNGQFNKANSSRSRHNDGQRGYSNHDTDDPYEKSQKTIEETIKASEQRSQQLEVNDTDSLFERVTKAYIRNYHRLLNRRND